MSLVCLTFSHQTTPIAFREKLYFDADSIANACARFRCGTDQPIPFSEFLILSTCNRTEFFGYCNEEFPTESSDFIDSVYQFIVDARDVTEVHLREYGQWHFGPDVAEHISRVACGLESLVIGEPQILGQVGDAMRLGLAMNSAGPVLARLFQTAIRSGRRARSETEINKHSLNISTVAVNTIEGELGTLEDKSVALLGAGEMAELALEQLHRRGASNIHVVNRTIAKADELASKYSGQAHVFEQIIKVLSEVDILITSTGAPHTLLKKDMIRAVMARRKSQPIAILDIAVPRDVDPGVKEIDGVFHCDIDELHVATGQGAEIRAQQIPSVEKIIDSELADFLCWLRSVGVDSIVAGLHKKAESIRSKELQRLQAILKNEDSEHWPAIERFAKSLVNKLLHDPITQLRTNHGERGSIDLAESIRQLFQIELDVKDQHARMDAPSTASIEEAKL